jgi:hypothetical protein
MAKSQDNPPSASPEVSPLASDLVMKKQPRAAIGLKKKDNTSQSPTSSPSTQQHEFSLGTSSEPSSSVFALDSTNTTFALDPSTAANSVCRLRVGQHSPARRLTQDNVATSSALQAFRFCAEDDSPFAKQCTEEFAGSPRARALSMSGSGQPSVEQWGVDKAYHVTNGSSIGRARAGSQLRFAQDDDPILALSQLVRRTSVGVGESEDALRSPDAASHSITSPPPSRNGSFSTDPMMMLLIQAQRIQQLEQRMNVQETQMRELKLELIREKFNSKASEVVNKVASMLGALERSVARDTRIEQENAELHALRQDPYKAKLYDTIVSALSAFYTAAAALSTGLIEISQTGSSFSTGGTFLGAVGEGLKAASSVPILGAVLGIIGSICTAINSTVILGNCADYRQLAMTQTDMDAIAKEFAMACIMSRLDSKKIHNSDTFVHSITTSAAHSMTNLFGNFVTSAEANAAKAGEDDGAILASIIIWRVIDAGVRSVQQLNARVLVHYVQDNWSFNIDSQTLDISEILRNSQQHYIVDIFVPDYQKYKQLAIDLGRDNKIPYQAGCCCNSFFEPSRAVLDKITEYLIADFKAQVNARPPFTASLTSTTIEAVAKYVTQHVVDGRAHYGTDTLCHQIAIAAKHAFNTTLLHSEHQKDPINPLALRPFEKPQTASCCSCDADTKKAVRDPHEKGYKVLAHSVADECTTVPYKPDWCGKTVITLAQDVYSVAAKHLTRYVKDVVAASKTKQVRDSKHLHDDVFIDGLVCRALHEADRKHYGTKDLCLDAAQRAMHYCNTTIGLEEDTSAAALLGTVAV